MTKVLFLEVRMGTRLCLHLIFMFLWYLLFSYDPKFYVVWQLLSNSYTTIYYTWNQVLLCLLWIKIKMKNCFNLVFPQLNILHGFSVLCCCLGKANSVFPLETRIEVQIKYLVLKSIHIIMKSSTDFLI